MHPHDVKELGREMAKCVESFSLMSSSKFDSIESYENETQNGLDANNTTNFNANSVGNVDNDSELFLRCKDTAKSGSDQDSDGGKNSLFTSDGFRSPLFYGKIKAPACATRQERKLETRYNSRSRLQNKFTNVRLKRAKDANSLNEVTQLHSAGAFHRAARTEHLRNVIREGIENSLDAVIETVMHEEYESRKKSSLPYHLCYREPHHCHSVHGKHLEICHPLQSILNGYCNQTMWTCAAEYINMLLIGYEYPPPVIILHLLDFILNSHEIAAVVKTIHTLSHFITTHPPNAAEMRQYYIDLLTTDCGHEFPKIKRNGFLHSIISLLEELNDDIVSSEFPPVTEFTDVAAEEEVTEGNRYNYKTLPREQKLQRLTWVLEWIADVFEIDFINFLANYQDNPSKYIKMEKTRPLVLVTLWRGAGFKGTPVHGVCDIIPLIEVWIEANISRRPLSFLQNLIKIIKLLAEAAFLCDFSLGPYPNYGSNCNKLARHIADALSDLKTEDILYAIHGIDPEWFAFRIAYLMTCKEVKRIPSKRITIENLVNLCYYVLGGTAEEDTNEGEVRRPSLVVQNEARRMSPGTQNITKRNVLGDSRLKRACSLNDAKHVLKLLRQPDVDASAADSNGWTALHEAAFKGSVQCVRALLSHKPKQGKKPINIHAKNINGITPLMAAVMGNKLEIAKLLLRYEGVSILHDKNSQGKTAIELATSIEMQKLLCDYAEKFSSNVRVSCLAISLAKLLIPFYISVYRIQHICKPQFQKAVKSSPLVLDLMLFKMEITNLKKLKYALENLPYLAEYEYLISALSSGRD